MPVETQIIHYPETEKYVQGQTRTVAGGYTGASGVTGGSQVYHQTYQTVAPTTTTYVTGGSRVAQPYVVSQPVTGYTTGGYTSSSYTPGYVTESYTTGPAYTSGTYGQTYTTTGNSYVTGGSGVRLNAGSGIRDNTYLNRY